MFSNVSLNLLKEVGICIIIFDDTALSLSFSIKRVTSSDINAPPDCISELNGIFFIFLLILLRISPISCLSTSEISISRK